MAEYLLALGTSPDWPAYEEWIGNHGGPAAVALDAKGNIYCGAEFAEGPPVNEIYEYAPDLGTEHFRTHITCRLERRFPQGGNRLTFFARRVGRGRSVTGS